MEYSLEISEINEKMIKYCDRVQLFSNWMELSEDKTVYEDHLK